MSGLEVLGAVAASVQLVQVIQSALRFINEARRYPKHANEQRDMHFHLVVQAIKFERWCAAMNVPDIIRLKEASPDTWRGTQEFLDFHARLNLDLRFGNDSIAQLTLEVLDSLREKFEAAWTMLQVYRRSDQEILVPSTNQQPKEKKKWYRRSSTLSKGSSQSFNPDETNQSKIIAAVKWAGFDKKTFSTLLDGIGALNDSLSTLLGVEKQEQIRRQAVMRILDDSVANSCHLVNSRAESELTTLLNLKVLLDADTEDSSVNNIGSRPFQVRTYTMIDFRGEWNKVGDSRSVIQHGEEKVLVEWLQSSRSRSTLQRTSRLVNLVGLLNHNRLHERFLAPKCKGLIDDSSNSRIGVLFSMSTMEVGLNATTQYQNLQEFIRSSPPTPSIGDRFLMAKKLALAMSNLHSVHWLHKSFRSDNVVFFQDPEGDTKPQVLDKNATTVESDVPGHSMVRCMASPLPQLYVVGWDLSRPDDSSEFSESRSRSSANYQNMKLYSHPETHSSLTTNRSRFRMQHDIYSLGLVLLEIGLWRTLEYLRYRCDTDEDFRTRVLGEFCNKLQARMGNIYWSATQRCIANDFDLQNTEAGEAADILLQSAFEQQVVSALSSCVA